MSEIQGTYAAVWLSSASATRLFHHFDGRVANLEPASSYHITTTYSKKVVALPPRILIPMVLRCAYFQYDVFGTNLVMKVKHEHLNTLFDAAKKLGATWDFPTYQPHITLSTNYTTGKLPPLPAFDVIGASYRVEELRD